MKAPNVLISPRDDGSATVTFSYDDDAAYAERTSIDLDELRTYPGYEFVSASTSDPKPGQPRLVVAHVRIVQPDTSARVSRLAEVAPEPEPPLTVPVELKVRADAPQLPPERRTLVIHNTEPAPPADASPPSTPPPPHRRGKK